MGKSWEELELERSLDADEIAFRESGRKGKNRREIKTHSTIRNKLRP